MMLSVLLVSAASADAATGDIPEAVRLFDEGTGLIEAGQYTQAIAAFESALAVGFENPALHYNLGVAHYRLDQLGEAVASFERARRLAPDDRMVLHNLSIAQARIRDQFSRLPDSFGQSIWRVLDRRLGAGILFGLGLLAYLIWCALMGVRARGAADSEWIRRGLWTSALVGLMGVGLGLGVSYSPAEPPAAVVGALETALFAAPLATDSPEMEIHEGLLVTVTGATSGWTGVQLPNGVTGWVRSEDLIPV
ncbi:MAG: tetratricopeptide (TPR) repeat protein [Rhodothermales bacterium]|jgi:tetratricopeptide (TPR) repeat protein